jgi:hypothetical protein
MKFLFGDSTEFPMHVDFLRLLNNFIDVSVKTISFENADFDLKETIMDRRRLKNSVIDEMDNFLLTVENSIEGALGRSKEREKIIEYADKSKVFLKKYIEDGKTKFSDEIFREIHNFEKKIEEADEANRKLLESFFINDPIPVRNKKFNIKATEKGYSANVFVEFDNGISCIFDIALFESSFWKGHVRARDFIKGLDIPARMKKPFLKKELVPDLVIIDDFYLNELHLSDKELEVIFRKKHDINSERFRLKIKLEDEFIMEIFHAEENEVEKNITADPDLKRELRSLRFQELRDSIIEQTNHLYTKKGKLEKIYVDDRDVLEENLIFELMQNVAEIFAPIISEIKEHSPSAEELSLKSEDESGMRHEIYLKKSDVSEKLDAIDEKGKKLIEILDIM